MKLSPRYLKRYKDIAILLLKYSQPEAATRFGQEHPSQDNAGNEDPSSRTLPAELERWDPPL